MKAEERRQAEEERAQRERELGVPEAQSAWDAGKRKIDDREAAAMRKARESEQAARERAETELAELGARPTLEAIEAVAE